MLHARTTPATCSVVAGRTTRSASCGTSPSIDQCNASGHQSRLASAIAPSSVTTSQIPEIAATKSSSRTTPSPAKCDACPFNSIGGVGDVVTGDLLCGTQCRVAFDLPGGLVVRPSEFRLHQRRDLGCRGEGGGAVEQVGAGPTGQHVVERRRHLVPC